MEKRKKQEAEFHDRARRAEEEGIEEQNKVFYDVTRKSQEFLNNYLIQNCFGKRALDYCCGSGGRSIFLAKSGAEVVGIDISSVSINKCKELAIKENLREKTNFLIMDAEKLNFEDNYFDLIVCTGVLHHLDLKKAYKELARVLKSDGKIICVEPLIHNPFFQLYRKLTPHLRTRWETEHILSKNSIELARKYFSVLETRFFHLFTLFAVPFRDLAGFNFILSTLEGIDSVILKLPFLKWWAWQIIFILSKPKNKYDKENI